MKNFFVRLFDSVLPPHPDVVVVREITRPLVSNPRTIYLNAISVTTLFEYKNHDVGACIRAVKYHHHPKATALLAEALKQHLHNLPEDTVVIPIPLSSTRLRQRGHNQMATVLRAAGIPYKEGILTRTERNSQTALTRADRFANISGVMQAVSAMIPYIAGKNILIIDDVVTTGATLAEAGRAMAIARPASVQYVTLAH